MERDQETGLDFDGKNYYNSNLGRYMTTSSNNTAYTKRPLSWNQYLYSTDDPVSEFKTTCGFTTRQASVNRINQKFSNMLPIQGSFSFWGGGPGDFCGGGEFVMGTRRVGGANLAKKGLGSSAFWIDPFCGFGGGGWGGGGGGGWGGGGCQTCIRNEEAICDNVKLREAGIASAVYFAASLACIKIAKDPIALIACTGAAFAAYSYAIWIISEEHEECMFNVQDKCQRECGWGGGWGVNQ